MAEPLRILTLGTFDLLHYGHLRLFQRASGFGRLIVGVNSDEFVETYKGQRPVCSTFERRALVAALECVDETHINHSSGYDLIKELKPDLIVIGSDWHEGGYLDQIGTDQAFLDEHEIGVLYLPRTPGVSTSERKKSLSPPSCAPMTTLGDSGLSLETFDISRAYRMKRSSSVPTPRTY